MYHTHYCFATNVEPDIFQLYISGASSQKFVGVNFLTLKTITKTKFKNENTETKTKTKRKYLRKENTIQLTKAKNETKMQLKTNTTLPIS